MDIQKNITNLLSELPAGVKLVAVTKSHPAATVLEAYKAGHKIFGENKVQELTVKYEELPKDIEWHLIGHLQTNKVKYIVPFVSLIHSIDSLKLLKEIDKEAAKINRVIDVLFEIYIADEETKYGLTREEAVHILTSHEFKQLKNVRIAGVMGMATYTDNVLQIRNEFNNLRKIFNFLKREFFPDKDYFKEISMGMSGDYQIAVEEGATIVRIGSIIFGERNYQQQ